MVELTRPSENKTKEKHMPSEKAVAPVVYRRIAKGCAHNVCVQRFYTEFERMHVANESALKYA